MKTGRQQVSNTAIFPHLH